MPFTPGTSQGPLQASHHGGMQGCYRKLPCKQPCLPFLYRAVNASRCGSTLAYIAVLRVRSFPWNRRWACQVATLQLLG